MSDFIQIGDRIISKAHIVAVEVTNGFPRWETKEVLILNIFVAGTKFDEVEHFAYFGKQASYLWEQLQHYLAPTVIQISEK